MTVKTSRKTAPRGWAALLTAAAVCALSACAADPGPAARAQVGVLTPLDQYPMRASQGPSELALAAHPGGLSLNQRAALADFALRWREGGSSPLVIRSPAGGPSGGLAEATARQAAEVLAAHGVPSRAIQVSGYAAAPGAPVPVLIGFVGWTAEVPDCAAAWGDVEATKDNLVKANFGCTVHSNLAVMIANPHDIVAPQAIDPADASRRADVLHKYRSGQKTSSERDEQAKGTVSSTIQ